MSNILGIDYGEKRIGLALADLEAGIATPYLTLENKGWQEVYRELQKIMSQEDVENIVVGLPLSLSGEESAQTEEAKKFYEFLKNILPIPVALEDERLTSKQVDSMSKKLRRVDRDAVAAMLILQTFIDKR